LSKEGAILPVCPQRGCGHYPGKILSALIQNP